MKSDQDSGFRWGPFEIHDDPKFEGRRPLYIQQKGGCVHYPYKVWSNQKESQHISQVDTTKPIIHKGNHFGHFTHARDYPDGTEWYFWDNCLLPQLMYKTEANPEGAKQWARIVYKSTMPGQCRFTEHDLDQHEYRVNSRIRQITGGRINSWEELCPIKTRPTEGDRVLLALSSDQALWHWYGLTPRDIESRVRSVCDRWGWQLDLRLKPDRRSRENGGSIRDQLRAQTYRCVVTLNSAAAIECLAEGVPVVALGAHSLNTMITPWQEFEKNWFCPPVEEWVRHRMREMLCLTWHKDELLDGSWSLSRQTQQVEPFNRWSIDFD